MLAKGWCGNKVSRPLIFLSGGTEYNFPGSQLVEGIGVPWASVPTHPHNEGTIKEVWGFIGVREGVRDAKAIGSKVGFVGFVGANVGAGGRMKGGSLD
jgi:hypothetical protein